MSEAILCSLITGGLAFAGVLVTNLTSNKKVVNDIKVELVKYQTKTTTEITELTREVREHNGFARRMPVVEEQIKIINNRLDDLKEKGA